MSRGINRRRHWSPTVSKPELASFVSPLFTVTLSAFLPMTYILKAYLWLGFLTITLAKINWSSVSTCSSVLSTSSESDSSVFALRLPIHIWCEAETNQGWDAHFSANIPVFLAILPSFNSLYFLVWPHAGSCWIINKLLSQPFPVHYRCYFLAKFSPWKNNPNKFATKGLQMFMPSRSPIY